MPSPKKHERSRIRGVVGLVLCVLSVVVIYARAKYTLPPSAFEELVQELRSIPARLSEDSSGGSSEETRDHAEETGTIDIRWTNPERRTQPVSAEHQPVTAAPPPPSAATLAGWRDSVVSVRTVSLGDIDDTGNRIRDLEESSGFIVWADQFVGLIVTSAHSVEKGEIEVAVGSADVFVPAEVVARDATADLALLRIGSRGLGKVESLRVGDTPPGSSTDACWIIGGAGRPALPGNRLGQPATVRRLLRDHYGPNPLRNDWFVLTPDTGKGFSGSPVVDSNGDVIGVIVAGTRDRDLDRSIATGPRALRAFLRKTAPHVFSST